jgi:hypothetical protein
MDLNLMVIDNFLDDPDAIREFALGKEFNVRGNYPGVRARWENARYTEELDSKLYEIIGSNVTHSGASKEFQICTEHEDKNWIHHDTKTLAGVLYLTPNAPLDYGTSIFRNKKTGIVSGDQATTEDIDIKKEEDWEETIRIGNVYNRLILYNGMLYHRSNNFGFGKTLDYSRLTQVFFMDLEEK